METKIYYCIDCNRPIKHKGRCMLCVMTWKKRMGYSWIDELVAKYKAVSIDRQDKANKIILRAIEQIDKL